MIRGKKITGILTAGVLCFALALPVQADELSETRERQQELEQQRDAAEEEQAELSSQLDSLVASMTETQEKLDAKQEEIQAAQDELDEARIQESRQYDAMKLRIKYMYENGSTGFIEILLESDGIADFLNKAEYIQELTAYDRNMLEEFQALVKQVEEKEARLKEEEAELVTMQESLSEQQAEVEQLLADKNVELSSLEAEIGENADKLEELIARAEEAARQVNSGGGGGAPSTPGESQVIGNGQLAWPTTSTRVTSYFGWREVPVAGATAYHDAIDIGVASGSPVYAADSGRVITAAYGYNGGRGVYVMIDHGNGMVTRYQHLSTIYVSVGDTVSRGQNIAASGNTGASSGPHLDFAVYVNGSAVNPLNYL